MVAFALGGLWLQHLKHHPLAGAIVAGTGVALFLVGAAAPAVLLALRGAWMKGAGAIGWVNSRIILSLFFFLLVTPIALIRRIRGRQALRWRPGTGSNWHAREQKYDPKHYDHPY